MTTTTAEPAAKTIDRAWVASEFAKGIEAEKEMAREARLRSESPPEAPLGVLYAQIADADERHRDAVTTIAVRYGHTPAHGLAEGIGEAIGHLKEKVTTLGSSPIERLGHDLAAKANAIHWYNAWEHAFESVGDTESARTLAAIMTEEKAHRDALQEVLDRLVEQGAKGQAAK